MFASTTYRSRRAALCTLLSDQGLTGLIAIFGNEESPMNYHDNTYPFRQDSNFLYFAAINQPHHLLLIDLETGQSTLHADDLSVDYVVWMGNQPSVAEKAAQIGADKHASYQAGIDALNQAAKQRQAVHYLPPYRADRVALLAETLGWEPLQVQARFSESLTRAVIALRSHKSEEELAEMEKAVNVTRLMHHAAMHRVRSGETESVVAGVVEGIAISGGGRLAYPCIGTINGHILHNHFHGNTCENGHLYLLDAGASSTSQYAADITRTFPVSGSFTAQQKEIYELVLKAENDSIAALRPGTPYLDIHMGAAKIITQGLQDLGLMKGDVDEAVAAGAHALFFPHGLGHMIGMDVHDMEDLNENWVGYAADQVRSTQFGTKSLRLAKPLEAGHVLTVEPGIYFIPFLMDRWRAEGRFSDFINYSALEDYRDFGGIRIEDNVLVTATGHRVLGESIAKTVAEVEAQAAR